MPSLWAGEAGHKRPLADPPPRENRMVPEDEDGAGVCGDGAVTDDRLLGRIISFNRTTGYGFIQTEDRAQWFMHVTQIEGDVEDIIGKQAMFTPGEGPKGKCALKVKVGER